MMEGTTTRDEHPRMSRHVSNCVVKAAAQSDVVTKVDKDSPANIDLAVARIIAHARMLYHRQAQRAPNVW